MNPAIKCFIGTSLMKIGQGLILTWGKCNIYYYSYYRHFDEELSPKYNTLPVAIMAIPIAIVSLVSIRIAKKIGYSTLIRTFALVQALSLVISSQMSSYFLFITFYLVLNATSFAITAYPLLGCLWSHYPKSEGRVTGFVLGVFSFATLFYVFILTYLINPLNLEANLQVHTSQKTDYQYFPYEVGQNVPNAVLTVGLIAGISMVLGSWLVTFNNQPAVKTQVFQEEQQEIEMADPRLQQYIQEPTQVDTSNVELRAAVCSQQFRIMFLAQFSLFLFIITLGLNFKSYALSKIDNDHYITLIDIIALVLSGALSLVWGQLTDRTNFVRLFTWVYFWSGVCAVLLALTKGQRNFTIFYLAVSLFDKGSLVIVGPGLVKIFGNDLGTQLLPIVNMGSLIAFVLSPILQLALLNIMGFDYFLALCGAMVMLTAVYNSRLEMKYAKYLF